MHLTRYSKLMSRLKSYGVKWFESHLIEREMQVTIGRYKPDTFSPLLCDRHIPYYMIDFETITLCYGFIQRVLTMY